MQSTGKIVLIGGTGRSGTTVLSNILACHPLVTVSPPLRFMIDPDGVLPFLSLAEHAWTPYSVDIAYKRLARLLRVISHAYVPKTVTRILWRWQRVLGWNLLPRYVRLDATGFCPRFPVLVDDFLKELQSFHYPANWVGTRFLDRHRMAYIEPTTSDRVLGVCRTFFGRFVDISLSHHGGTTLVDRNTWNHLWFREYLRLFPHIKLIHIRRDPRDVIASYTQQNWMPRDAVQAARIYCNLAEQWCQVRGQIPPSSYIDVAIEELVSAPEETLRHICRFIELPWDDALLSIKLNKSHRGRWHEDIPAAQVPEVERILGRWIEYESDTQS